MLTVVFDEPVSRETAQEVKAAIERLPHVALVDAEMGLIIRRESMILDHLRDAMSAIQQDDLRQFALNYATGRHRDAQEF